MAARSWGKGRRGGLTATVSVWEDKKVLEMDGGDGCTIEYLMPQKSTLTNG